MLAHAVIQNKIVPGVGDTPRTKRIKILVILLLISRSYVTNSSFCCQCCLELWQSWHVHEMGFWACIQLFAFSGVVQTGLILELFLLVEFRFLALKLFVFELKQFVSQQEDSVMCNQEWDPYEIFHLHSLSSKLPNFCDFYVHLYSWFVHLKLLFVRFVIPDILKLWFVYIFLAFHSYFASQLTDKCIPVYFAQCNLDCTCFNHFVLTGSLKSLNSVG